MSDLGTLTTGRSNSQGNGINDFGQVTGNSISNNGFPHAFITNNGVMSDLGTLGGVGSYGQDINNSGQVTGSSSEPMVTTTPSSPIMVL